MGKRKLIGLLLFLLFFVFTLAICGGRAAAQHQWDRGPAASSGRPAASAQTAFPLYGQPPKPVPRKPCQLIEDWVKAGGTRANFSGVGIGTFPKPFPLCFPLLAKISHTAHERYVDRCGQTHLEVNLAYEMEHEGELWLTQDLSQAYANIHQFSGQQRSFRLRRGDGFYFAGHDHDACRHYDRHAFTAARRHPYLGVRLTLYAPPDSAGQRLYYMPPLFEEPERILTYACATWFSITPANEQKVSFSLPVEELRGLREGQVVSRELAWGGDEPETGHHWTNRMTFELRATGGPGRLDVTPADGLIARGPGRDGTFSPLNKTYTLKNAGQSPIDFAVSKSRDWVSVAPAGGSLTPGAETRVAVSINERARKLKASEKDTVRFDNRTNGEGSTTRPVELATRERWRVTFIGWDTISTDNVPLNAGIRAYWTIAVDIEIEGGQYKSGRATASFGNTHGQLASYSFIPGAYACSVSTKSIDFPAFSVNGSVSGSIVRLRLLGENFLRLNYRCTLDETRALDWLRTNKYGGQSPEDRVRGVDKDLRRAGTEALPSGTYAVRLADGLREPVNSPGSLNASPLEITVKRLE